MVCDAYKKVTMHLHEESSGMNYNYTNVTVTLSDDRRRFLLIAVFDNLPDDKYYRATIKVLYDQFIQHSLPVETSEYYYC